MHTADIHLDSPMLNLERYEGAPIEAFRSATRSAMANLVELAVKSQTRFVLFSGDLYDGECRDIHTAIAFRRQLEELSSHGIKSFIVQGNHDAASKVTKAFGNELPEGAHLFPVDKPGTVEISELGVAIHGQGFAEVAITDDLSAAYPAPVQGRLNLGLLHTNCGGSPHHDNYAPTTVDRLARKGYDYWALGHVHEFKVLRSGDPWVVYPGNLQGRNIREVGPKGCVQVTVDDGTIISVDHVPLDVTRWARCQVDVSGRVCGRAVVAAVADALDAELKKVAPRKLAIRLTLVGVTGAHRELSTTPATWKTELREMAATRFDDSLWLEKIRFRTEHPVDLTTIDTREDALGGLLRQIRELSSVDEAIETLRDELADMQASWPCDERLDGGTLPDLDDPEQRAALLEDVKQMLLPRLLTEGGDT